MLRLVTIPISHYCEKARWALQRAGIEYREEPHVQGVHRVMARRAGGGRTVPVLVRPEGPLAESEDIVRWAEPGLFEGSEEILELARRFDEGLGPASRRLVYVHMLAPGMKERMLEFNNKGVPGWEDRLLRAGWPLLVRYAKRELMITPGVERWDEALCWRELDFVGERLGDGRRYLCGDEFSAADLTFAAMCAPLIVPSPYGVPLPQPDTLPPHVAELIERVRAHPAGEFALRMFAERS